MTAYSHQQRQKIAELAAHMLAGSLPFLEGAANISRMRLNAELSNDPDILPFVLIESETDDLPLTANVRKQWKPDALEKLQPEIDRAEEWARSISTLHCESLISRFKKQA